MLLGKVVPPEMSLGRVIAGAGNKPWRWNLYPFLDPPEATVDSGPDSELDF
jgi:hypothetical protein